MDGLTSNQSSNLTLDERPVIRLSPATLRDAPAITSIFLRSFSNGPLFPILTPRCANIPYNELDRLGVPLEVHDFKRYLVSSDISIKASVLTMNERNEMVEKVVGCARYTSPDRTRKRTLWEWFLSAVVFPIYYDFIKRIRTPECTNCLYDLLAEQYEQVFGKGRSWEGRRHWYFRLLCVDPEWQGRGVGSALLEWGFERARQDGSLIYLEASQVGQPIYEAKGYQLVINSPREICGRQITAPGMIWEPRLNVK